MLAELSILKVTLGFHQYCQVFCVGSCDCMARGQVFHGATVLHDWQSGGFKQEGPGQHEALKLWSALLSSLTLLIPNRYVVV